jgi:hypothetical protein
MTKVFRYIQKRKTFFECVIFLLLLWTGEKGHHYRVNTCVPYYTHKESQPHRKARGRRATPR